jgi:hypothetical protein
LFRGHFVIHMCRHFQFLATTHKLPRHAL